MQKVTTGGFPKVGSVGESKGLVGVFQYSKIPNLLGVGWILCVPPTTGSALLVLQKEFLLSWVLH